ncbi:hypothetical protein PO78_100 [Thauera sp. SWB20]|nr:hypothetical protein PO78_100 [Thauera sp. SWB20]
MHARHVPGQPARWVVGPAITCALARQQSPPRLAMESCLCRTNFRLISFILTPE